jgi:hypothetical protein
MVRLNRKESIAIFSLHATALDLTFSRSAERDLRAQFDGPPRCESNASCDPRLSLGMLEMPRVSFLALEG